MELDILKLIKESIVSIANKQGITNERDIKTLQKDIEILLTDNNLEYPQSDNNNEAKEPIIKKIIFYETEEEFYSLLNNNDKSIEYTRVVWIDEWIAWYIACVFDLSQICNFHDYEKGIQNYQAARERLMLVENIEQRLNQGVDLFIIKYSDCCDEKYSNRDFCMSIVENINIEIETDVYLIQALSYFKAYWNSVLHDYVRKHAYRNRLQYLINYTEDLKGKNYIKNNSQMMQKITEVQSEYTTLLNACQDKTTK